MTARRWFRGNTHTHTTYSDGDSSPEVVAEWYAAHAYDFVFLTDHNAMIPDHHLRQVQRQGLAVWQGEEVTTGVVHVGGLGLREAIRPGQQDRWPREPYARDGRIEWIRWAIERILAQGAVPSVNHPNRWDALRIGDLDDVGDARLIEIANMSPEAARANPGDLVRPSTERLWDHLLGLGRTVWGVASDDAHHFKRWGPHWSNPGRGWVMVDAPSTGLDDLLQALRDGHFYASTGLHLADYAATSQELAIDLETGPALIELIGPGCEVLQAVDSWSARFPLRTIAAPYLRIRVTAPGGQRLWTQPHYR